MTTSRRQPQAELVRRAQRNERDNMTSAPDSVNARLMHEAPAPVVVEVELASHL